MIYEGYHVDTASTIIIGTDKGNDAKAKERFVHIGEETLRKAIAVAKPGNRIGHISSVIQTEIEQAGYHVVKDLTGHGVGKVLHEEPMIPEYLHGSLERTPLITSGMTLAIEVIYAMGKGSIVYAGDDGWTLVSRDASLTATFEHSIAITESETVVLTKSKN